MILDDDKLNIKVDGTLKGKRRNINLISGTGVTVTGADDSANDEVDVTITSAGGAMDYAWNMSPGDAYASNPTTQDRVYISPIFIPGTLNVAFARIRKGTGGTAGDYAALGLYNKSGSNAAQLVQCTFVWSGAANMFKTALSYNITTPGPYYLVFGTRGSGANFIGPGSANGLFVTYWGYATETMTGTVGAPVLPATIALGGITPDALVPWMAIDIA